MHYHIAALEAELNASREAWDVATATKVNAEKTAKSAENKAKKLKKHLPMRIRGVSGMNKR
jgi:hypothetical protein